VPPPQPAVYPERVFEAPHAPARPPACLDSSSLFASLLFSPLFYIKESCSQQPASRRIKITDLKLRTRQAEGERKRETDYKLVYALLGARSGAAAAAGTRHYHSQFFGSLFSFFLLLRQPASRRLVVFSSPRKTEKIPNVFYVLGNLPPQRLLASYSVRDSIIQSFY